MSVEWMILWEIWIWDAFFFFCFALCYKTWSYSHFVTRFRFSILSFKWNVMPSYIWLSESWQYGRYTHASKIFISWAVKGLPEIFKLKIICIISEDDDISVWMFAMIGIGCVFVVFVAVSVYLMWWVTDIVWNWGSFLAHWNFNLRVRDWACHIVFTFPQALYL